MVNGEGSYLENALTLPKARLEEEKWQGKAKLGRLSKDISITAIDCNDIIRGIRVISVCCLSYPRRKERLKKLLWLHKK